MSELFKNWKDEMGIRDTWDYDYHSAWLAGEKPDSTGHWRSKYKHDLSEERYVKTEFGWWDTKQSDIQGKNIYVPFMAVIMQTLKRKLMEN